jgi:hypothetical protein
LVGLSRLRGLLFKGVCGTDTLMMMMMMMSRDRSWSLDMRMVYGRCKIGKSRCAGPIRIDVLECLRE